MEVVKKKRGVFRVGELVWAWGDKEAVSGIVLEEIEDYNRSYGVTRYKVLVQQNGSQQIIERLGDRLWRSKRSVKRPIFERVTFPAIRKVYPSLISQEIISVQPMTAPTGLLAFLDYSFTDTTFTTTATNTSSPVQFTLSGSTDEPKAEI